MAKQANQKSLHNLFACIQCSQLVWFCSMFDFLCFCCCCSEQSMVLGLTEKASTVVGSSPACSLSGTWGHPPRLPFQTGKGRPRPAWLQPVQLGAEDGGGRQLAEEKQLFVKFSSQGFLWCLLKGVGYPQPHFLGYPWDGLGVCLFGDPGSIPALARVS